MGAGVPLDQSRGGSVLRGPRTWNLDQFALYDKIINLKFYRDSGDILTIRSDYEVAFSKDVPAIPYFIPIRQKPSIKVTYTQVSNDTSIKLNIEVVNLYLYNKTLDDTIYRNNRNSNPIKRVEIQMGYRQQFPDWTLYPNNTDVEGSPNRLDTFYKLEDYRIEGGVDNIDTGLKIMGDVLAIYPNNLPPDQVTVFQCAVGTMQPGIRWQTTEDTDIQNYFDTESNFPTPEAGTVNDTLDKILFLCITQRFFKNGDFLAKTYDSALDPDYTGTSPKKTISVLDYDLANNEMLPLAERTGTWVELPQHNGLMTVKDALSLGVICTVSPKLKEMIADNDFPSYDLSGNPVRFGVKRAVFINYEHTVQAQMIEIRNSFPTIRWYQRVDGSLLIYDIRELAAGAMEIVGTPRADLTRLLRPIILPAVYDISISGIRTVRCPFISFVSPGQLVGFSARYNISTLVGYFYPHQKDQWFRPYMTSIEFSTTGNENTMIMKCTDSDGPNNINNPLANENPGETARVSRETAETKYTLEWEMRTVAVNGGTVDPATQVPGEGWSYMVTAILNNTDLIEYSDLGMPVKPTYADAINAWRKNFTNNYNFNIWVKERNQDPTAFTIGWSGPLPYLYPGDEVYMPRMIATKEESA